MIKLIKICWLLWGSFALAQPSHVTGTVEHVVEDGLYRIHIPHQIRSFAAFDLRDIRVWDDKNNQVPYFVQPASDYQLLETSGFVPFEMLSQTRIPDSTSTYIFRQPYSTLEKAVLLMTNYHGNKSYQLEGSHDQEIWFGIINNAHLNHLSHPTQTEVSKEIRFPLVDYPYLKLVFDDRKSLPLNLLNVGMANPEKVNLVPMAMEEIPEKKITFIEKGKVTQIHIQFDKPEVIDQIIMEINAPQFFNREAILYTLKKREVKRTMETYRQHLAMFSIRSDKNLIFNIPNTIASELYLEIDNKDNPKLNISDLRFNQESVYLVSSLKTGQSYKVTAGNEQLKAPEYDLAEVSNAEKTMLPILEISHIVMGRKEFTTTKATHFLERPWFMWSCIGIATLMIAYFALNMLKEMERDKNK